ncbi:YlbG family protein [Streptococcus marmotae]|uniref:YlbG family protein n=1 Tax=Streptococcus marmotae TaxID=1825069 RepID=UPI000829B267|nr:YlbG family protein [Streptococcus marmotae]
MVFEKQERVSLAVYLHYNRDARKLSQYGDIIYHSRRLRYLLLYVPQESVETLMATLKKERFVKKVVPSHFKEMDRDFVGSLWRQEEEKNSL